MNNNYKYTIVHGNPIDGIALLGVFETAEEANDMADRLKNVEWWIAEIENVNTQDKE